MLRDPAVSTETGSAFTSPRIDSPVVTIALIDLPRARDIDMLTLAITISYYRYSTSAAISKGCGEQPCVPRLTSYSKAPLRLSLPKGSLPLKHMYWEKALIPCSRTFANHLNLP